MSFGTFAILLGINAALAACLLLFNTRRGGALRMGAWLWLSEFATARTKAVGDELAGGEEPSAREHPMPEIEPGQRLIFRDLNYEQCAMIIAQAVMVERGLNPLDMESCALCFDGDGESFRSEVIYDSRDEAWKEGARA